MSKTNKMYLGVICLYSMQIRSALHILMDFIHPQKSVSFLSISLNFFYFCQLVNGNNIKIFGDLIHCLNLIK